MSVLPARRLRHVSRAIALIFTLSCAPFAPSPAQPGIAQPVAVGPFLNGVLPADTPLNPTGADWIVSPAFPNISADLTTVIEPHPLNDNLYVASRDGLIITFDNDPAATQSSVFVDLRDRAGIVDDGGFLGLVFDPQIGAPGGQHDHMYVWYVARCGLVGPHPTKPGGYEIEGEFMEDDGQGGQQPIHPCVPPEELPQNFGDAIGFWDGYLRLSRFDVDLVSNVADAHSEIILVNIQVYNGSHRGGGMVFTDDGYLWVTIGDQYRYDTAQDIVDNFEGGIIRIDININDNGDGTWSCPVGSHLPRRLMDDVSLFNDFPAGIYEEITGKFYCVPDDNPWLDVNGGLFEEFATIGHRAPHRLTRDPLTGRLWSGEIGSTKREEINVIEKGRNYGWPFREGIGPGAGGYEPPPVIRGILTDPVIDYFRSDSASIIGGYVYRGSKFPELYGKYLAGDYVTNKIWSITLDEASMTATSDELTTFTSGGLSTWGQDKDGEIFLGDTHALGQSLFTLERTSGPVADAPEWLSQLGAFDDLPTADPADFWVPYDLAQPFWSDGARKTRYIALPNDGTRDTAAEQINFSPTAIWRYPVGTVLMKHFELPLDETDTAVTARLETRFMVLDQNNSWYGLTYRWLPDLSDAQLLKTEQYANYTIQLAGGGTRQQQWFFPSRDQCLFCHADAAGGAVGPTTFQLNSDYHYVDTGITSNQLETWNHLGMFDEALTATDIAGFLRGAPLEDATRSVEARARAWLDSNCAYCHRPETGRAAFDARFTTPLELQKLVDGFVATTYGIPNAHVITAGDPASSIAYIRALSTDPLVMMPPLAKTLPELPATELLGEWIERVEVNEPINGINYEYYETGPLTQLPDFDSLVPVATGQVDNFDISVRQRDDDFALRFSGKIYIDEAGGYAFYTRSDEGSQLFIDGQLVVDNDGLHTSQQVQGGIDLEVGYHDIVVTYFEATGAEELSVNWRPPELNRRQVPDGVLYLDVPVPIVNAAPVLTSPGAQVLTEGEPFALALSATDADLDDLWYSANNLPDGLTLDNDTGSIGGSPAPGTEGTHDVVLGVSDGPEVDSVALQWIVNVAPQFTQPADQVSDTGDAIALQIDAWDTQALIYTATGLPVGLAIGSSDGLISGAIAGAPGTYAVTVTLDDGFTTVDVPFAWYVTLPGLDGDGDGMSDIAEIANGTDPNVDDAALDQDSDTFTNGQEAAAGTAPDSAASQPEGLPGVPFVLFRDHFDDAQYDDRWYPGMADPGTTYVLAEFGTQLNATTLQPVADCNGWTEENFARIDAAGATLRALVDPDAAGATVVGVLRDLDYNNLVEVRFNQDSAPYLELRSIDDGVLTTLPDTATEPYAGATEVRIAKLNTAYHLFVDGRLLGDVTNAGLGDADLRPYLGETSCVADAGDVDSNYDLVEILLDSDGDALPDLREDVNFDGTVDAGESDAANPDTDGDLVLDGFDNCVLDANAGQSDADGDGVGDACDPDFTALTLTVTYGSPVGVVGQVYYWDGLQASGGQPPYTFAIVSGGPLIPTLTLQNAPWDGSIGTVWGTPTSPTAGAQNLTFQVTDANLDTATIATTMTIRFTASYTCGDGCHAAPGF
jgi:uncharacterized repeat protein (TIGR03806 family)